MTRSYTKKRRNSCKRGGMVSFEVIEGNVSLGPIIPSKPKKSRSRKESLDKLSLNTIGFTQSDSEIAAIKNELEEAFEAEFDKKTIDRNNIAFNKMFSKFFGKEPKNNTIERAIFEFVRSITTQLYTYYDHKISGGSRQLVIRKQKVNYSLLMSAFSLAIGLFSLFVVYLMWVKVANKTGLADIGDEAEFAVNTEFQKFEEVGGKSFFMFLYNSIFNRALYTKFFANIQKKAFAKLVSAIGEEGNRVSDICYTGNMLADAFYSVFSAESLTGCMGAVVKNDIDTLSHQIAFQVKLLEYDFLGMYRLINIAVVALPAGVAGVIAVARPAIKDREEMLALEDAK